MHLSLPRNSHLKFLRFNRFYYFLNSHITCIFIHCINFFSLAQERTITTLRVNVLQRRRSALKLSRASCLTSRIPSCRLSYVLRPVSSSIIRESMWGLCGVYVMQLQCLLCWWLIFLPYPYLKFQYLSDCHTYFSDSLHVGI